MPTFCGATVEIEQNVHQTCATRTDFGSGLRNRGGEQSFFSGVRAKGSWKTRSLVFVHASLDAEGHVQASWDDEKTFFCLLRMSIDISTYCQGVGTEETR